VCKIEDALTATDFVTVDASDLFHLLLTEEEECFHNVRIQVPSSGLEFGVHDSTFLFLEADQIVLERIAEHFHSGEVGDRA
jgi:hypothetical protein